MSTLGQIVTGIGIIIEIIALRSAWDKLPSNVSIIAENIGHPPGYEGMQRGRRLRQAFAAKRNFKKEAQLIGFGLVLQLIGVFL